MARDRSRERRRGGSTRRTSEQPGSGVSTEAKKEELVSIESYLVPRSAGVGEGFTVGVDVSNDAKLIVPGDPDRCTSEDGSIPVPGYTLEVALDVGGVQQLSEELCLGTGGTKSVQFDVPGVSTVGTKRVSVTVTATGSGRQLASDENTIRITSSGSDGGGGTGGGGDDGSDDGSDTGDDTDNDSDDDSGNAGLREFWSGLSRGEKIALGLTGGAAALVITDRGQARRR